MALNKRTIKDLLPLDGKRVLVRVDFNVPLKNSVITDDTRIRAALPTIQFILANGGSAVLMSHLGRPKGVDASLSLQPAALRLGELLGVTVKFATDCVGPAAEEPAKALKAGEVLLLENLRFHKEEEKNDPDFARQLAALGDVYVDDAFGSAHRAHASVEAAAHFLPAAAGFLMEKEINFLGGVLEAPEHPLVVILGGAKISDKLPVINNLLPLADVLIIGGGMANTFLKAEGYEMGDSLVEPDAIEKARELLACCSGKLMLPLDAVVADAFSNDANSEVVSVGNVKPGWRILDIGPHTTAHYTDALRSAKMILWNGPMGVFEFPKFAAGTTSIAKAVAASSAITVIGGGDSVAAVEQAGVADKITHISTGGGASLEFLEGKTLPGVAVLPEK
ncbi:MAG: phosphoglycerate kinase [Chloroflexi bacterium]|nr:phosphoglycerate kinase [Chloroflexota bacterium]MCL5273965.1 phosphoglycerate kinase [Chloroflexota bacterium]